MDQVSDLLTRYQALNKARVKANAETKVKVPTMLTFNEILSGKEVGEEEITIAEAITRKKMYVEDLMSILSTMLHKQGDVSTRKGRLDVEARNMIEAELNSQFPRDVQKNWSSEAQKKAREELEKKYEVVRVDPKDTIKNESFNHFKFVVTDYINNIDRILSEANAKTEVTIEY
jgi:hypothetical protein